MYTLQKSIVISTLHRRTGSGADRVQNGSIKPRLCRASSACMDSRLVTGLAVLARSHWQPRRCKHSERFPVATCTPSTLLQVRGCCWDWSRWVRRLSCIYTHLGWFCGGMYSRRSPSSSMFSFFETSWHADACVCHPQPCNAGGGHSGGAEHGVSLWHRQLLGQLTFDRRASRTCLMLTTCRGEPGVFLGLTPAGLSVTGCTGRPAAKRLHFMRSEITIEMTINGQGVRISEVGVHRRADSCKGYFSTITIFGPV